MASVADFVTSLAASLAGAVASLLCRPCYEEIQNTMQVLSSPESLFDDLQQLSDMENQVKAMGTSSEIESWISEADKILQDSRSPNLNNGQQSCCFSSDACFRCKLQKKIKKMIVQGNRIIKLAKMQPKPVEPFHEVPSIEDDSVVGRNMRQAMDMLKDDNIWRIGIWGPGGVGKTTLAKALNNRLEGTSFFNLVIFISVTKDVDVKGIQKDIARRLGQNVEEGMDSRYVAEQIRNRLQREKFLLLLDNIWEDINLLNIGIPEKQAESKIVLTTRRLEVCRMMDARPLKIGFLTDEEAWQLFLEKAGEVVSKEEISPLAKMVCQECGRLPLALVAVGSAMKGKTEVDQWRSAINDLQCSIPISGIEDQVYNALRFSYDRLENDTLRFCFLYCSLYPEGWAITVSELVHCWLAEKVIDEQLYYVNAFSKGLDLITQLINSCLLEENYWIVDEIIGVKMHDVVRDFARWIVESDGKSITFSGHGTSRGPMVILPELEKVKNLEWISFVNNEEIELPQQSMDFPKVTTFLFHGSRKYKVKITQEFLKGFQSVRVLNVGNSQPFPCSNLCFPELRALFLWYCGDVNEIPCTLKLMILDLSGSSFSVMPRGVERLTHLRVLILRCTTSLQSVDIEIISNMHSLEYLDTRLSGYKWPTKRKFNSKEATLQDLSGLKELKSVCLDLADVECSYKDCDWMNRLENYIYTYGCHGSYINYDKTKGKDVYINRKRGTEVGSFIFHAEMLILQDIQNLSKTFITLTSQSNSKLKELNIVGCSFSEGLTGLAPNSFALSNLECLAFGSSDQVTSFSQLANTLGTSFPKLRRFLFFRRRNGGGENERLKISFFSNDPHIQLPNLEQITLSGCLDITEVFHYGPTKIQAVAPNLRKLRLDELPSLERLCNSELTEQWQSLEILRVGKCPNLKKLPRMPSIKKIRGEEEWWNNLEWDSPETKSYMYRFFQPREISDLCCWWS